MKKLPIGIQTFEKIIKENYLYIDKTKQIYNFMNSGDYFFLSRPRRFGKSLLVSTLKEIFSGNKELFKNLWISKSEYVWQEYPIILLDFSTIGHSTPEELKASLSWELSNIASLYEVEIDHLPSIETTLKALVYKLAKKNKVVILIDEYDKPMLDHITNIKMAEAMQGVLRSFYSAVKGLDAHLKFIFLTGVTKFAKTSVFSGLNNLIDLTTEPIAAELLGYTQEEVDTYFTEYITPIANQQNTTVEAIRNNAKVWYNGYRFSREDVKVYNPYSILFYLNSGYLFNYWFETGTPSFLVNLIKTKGYSIESIENAELNTQDMRPYDIDDIRLIPLLFQTGYLTIKSYNPVIQNYVLDYPNEETKVSFLHYFVSNITTAPVSLFNSSILKLTQTLRSNNIDLFFQTLEVFFASIPYTMQLSQEKYYQSIFYVIVNLIGAYIQAEVTTSEGRIDATIETRSHVYIFEFKLNKSAEEALEQIKEKRYYQKYLQSDKQIILIGVSFSLDKRNIDKWLVEEMPIR